MSENREIPSLSAHGEPARLIPVVADSFKEGKATSALLAALMAVEEYGKHMLSMVGAPATKRARIECYSEVTFKEQGTWKPLRPDGLIVVSLGNRHWHALIEAKVGSAELEAKQLEDYLDLAKRHGLDALITISNQFTALPTHHPVQISGKKTQSVSLFHWSWTALVSEARLFIENKGVSDPDQGYILSELIRYLRHPSSGVIAFNRMPPAWKLLCENARNNALIKKTAPETIEIVASWHQLVRFLALELSVAVGTNVSVYLSRAHIKNPETRLKDSIAGLVDDYWLEDEFEIPNSAAHLTLAADLRSRTLLASMWLKAPTDRSRATACITWIRKQLDTCEDEEVLITATYRRGTKEKQAMLREIREDQKILVQEDLSILPNWFQVKKTCGQGGRFAGAKTFVQDAHDLVLSFYKDVGQHLIAWNPPTPKLIDKKSETSSKDKAPDEVTRKQSLLKFIGQF